MLSAFELYPRWVPLKISYNILLYIVCECLDDQKITTQYSFLVITSLHGINNDWSIQTCLPGQATRRYVWNSGCFAVQQHFPEANSKFEENEEMLNSEMEGGGVGDKSP